MTIPPQKKHGKISLATICGTPPTHIAFRLCLPDAASAAVHGLWSGSLARGMRKRVLPVAFGGLSARSEGSCLGQGQRSDRGGSGGETNRVRAVAIFSPLPINLIDCQGKKITLSLKPYLERKYSIFYYEMFPFLIFLILR
jgi:hypothetical protein